MRKYVVVCALLAGCAAGGSDELQTAATVQNIGLQTSAVPPLGEGVSPAIGIGGDGAAVVTRVGGWSGGPGAVTWHGGQWVMAYQPRPGQTLANVSCDVWNPTTAAPANVLVEVVSSNGQVLGSATAPASTSVVFRLWPFVGSHVFTDGEQAVVRISPRDATTGAWTTAAQDTTVIGCAINASRLSTITISPTSFSSATWSFVVGPNAMQANTSGILVGGLPSHPGDTIRSFTIPVRGPVNSTIVAAVKVADNGMNETVIGSGQILLTSSWVPFVVDVTDTTVPSNGAVTMIITASAAGVIVGNIAMQYSPGT